MAAARTAPVVPAVEVPHSGAASLPAEKNRSFMGKSQGERERAEPVGALSGTDRAQPTSRPASPSARCPSGPALDGLATFGRLLAFPLQGRYSAWLEAEPDAVIGGQGEDSAWHGRDKGLEESGRCEAHCTADQLGEDEFAGALNGSEEGKLAFSTPHLGDVDVKEADWVRFESPPDRLGAIDLGQARDPVSLQAKALADGARKALTPAAAPGKETPALNAVALDAAV